MQTLQLISPEDPSYAPLFHEMRTLCRRVRRLPPEYQLHPGEVSLVTHETVSSTAMSDVYRGVCNRRLVAVKTLRVYGETRAEVQRVSSPSVAALSELLMKEMTGVL
jgi:hypothetical protein